MHKPLVTVAISFFNNQHSIVDAIASVLNQTLTDWQLILIDDGSTDQSLALARQFTDERIRLIADGQNKGLVARLNQSVALADGAYYARMDADDVMHPERLQKQVDFLRQHAEVDVVDTAMYVMDQDGNITGKRDRRVTSDPTLWTLLSGKVPHHATVMGKIAWFRANPYDPVYVRAEDYELWCRTFSNSLFAHIPSPLYFVREGKVNVSNYRKSQRTARVVIRRYGYRHLNPARMLALIIATYGKEVIYGFMGLLNAQHILTDTRNMNMQSDELLYANEMLDRATRLPI